MQNLQVCSQFRYTKFHEPSHNGTLVTATKLKSKDAFRTAAIVLVYILKTYP